MQAVFLDAGTFGKQESFEGLKALPLQWSFYDRSSPSEIEKRAKDAEIVVLNKSILDPKILRALPHLKLICVTATGVNCVDLETAKQLGIAVCNVPQYSTASVPQLTLLLLLALANQFAAYQDDIRKGRWQKESHFSFFDHPIQEIKGKSLGILGYGNLGKEVARLASAFGMQILLVEHPHSKRPLPQALPLEEVLRRCDFFTIHAPLNTATQNLIGKKELSWMKKSAYILNVSRGGIIDEIALKDALKQGTIAGAALDVLSQEPPPPDHPLLDPTIPHLLLTPHIGWASLEARRTLLDSTRKNIEAYLQGNIQNQVNS